MNTEITHKARDIIQKYASGLFKDSALEFYGIQSAKIKELINVELPVVKVADSSTDYIFLLEDDTYLHLEFQTTNKKEDLARFAAYDWRLYERDKRDITTVIIYSSEIKEADPHLKIGSATYNPQKIMMNDYNGNDIYEELDHKIKACEDLTDVDLMNLIFLPLMKHTIPKNELAIKSVELAKTIPDKDKRDICIASAVAFAEKYLSDSEKNNLLEVLKMASLIDMIVADGLERGMQQGIEKGKREGKIEGKREGKIEGKREGKIEGKIEAAKNLFKKGMTAAFVQEVLELDEQTIQNLQVSI